MRSKVCKLYQPHRDQDSQQHKDSGGKGSEFFSSYRSLIDPSPVTSL